jgi:ArsR family transcriptional regulator, arsenate/arsenite/antimonite-responsive transcriptional repressor
MRDLMRVFKALADESRVRILHALAGGELCVCQIVELLGRATSTVSKHLSILHQARLVDSRKQGRWVYFRLADGDAPRAARELAALLPTLLADERKVRDDDARLAQILQQDPESLCQKCKPC